MWIYIGILLIIFGIWQAFMQGRLSLVSSGIGIYLGIFIIFLSSWRLGLALLIIFVLFLLFGQIIGSDKKKIRGIITAFRDGRKQFLNSSEDAICRNIIVNRLYATRITNPIGIRTIDEAELYVKQTFHNPVTIQLTCYWIVTMEKANPQKITEKSSKKSDKLYKIIDYYIEKML